MRISFIFFILYLTSFVSIGQVSKVSGLHTIKGRVEGLANVDVYLANYYGNKLFFNDTCHVDAIGNFSFVGKTYNECGKYALVLPGPRYFDFIVAEEDLVINCSADAGLNSISVEQSNENQLFFDYLRYLNYKKLEREAIEECINDIFKSKKEKKECTDELANLNSEVVNYQNDLIQNNRNSLFAKYLRMGMEMDIPAAPSNLTESKKQAWQYYWYRQHYWDRCDLKDPRMVRDGAFHRLVEDYITKTLPQIPDTVCYQVRRLVEQTKGNEESFKYIVHYATHYGETSEINGMRKLFVFMIDNYYSKGKCAWVKEEKLKEMIEAANKYR
jgi:hypothetical protein